MLPSRSDVATATVCIGHFIPLLINLPSVFTPQQKEQNRGRRGACFFPSQVHQPSNTSQLQAPSFSLGSSNFHQNTSITLQLLDVHTLATTCTLQSLSQANQHIKKAVSQFKHQEDIPPPFFPSPSLFSISTTQLNV